MEYSCCEDAQEETSMHLFGAAIEVWGKFAKSFGIKIEAEWE